MRLFLAVLGCAAFAVGSGCTDGQGTADRVTRPLLEQLVRAGASPRGGRTAKDEISACSSARGQFGKRKCPRRCEATSRCPRDGGGVGRVVRLMAEFDVPGGKGTCPFVANEESGQGSGSGVRTMEF